MLLQLGSTGDEVKQLQAKLGISADGDFGPQTEAAVKAWQAANGLSDDGIVGALTWGKMFAQAPASATAPATGTAPITVAGGDLNLASLRGVIPGAVIAQIPATAKQFGINNILRLAHFLAQCGHESAGFTAIEENLNYSAAALQSSWPSKFPDVGVADAYARQPQKIGARAYANRMGNGDEASGDGYTFRGRGYIQTTGKANYRAFGQFIGTDVVGEPDLVAHQYPLSSAAFFFQSNNLWRICDEGASDATVTAVTRVVNGGTNGLADRIARFQKYYGLLSAPT